MKVRVLVDGDSLPPYTDFLPAAIQSEYVDILSFEVAFVGTSGWAKVCMNEPSIAMHIVQSHGKSDATDFFLLDLGYRHLCKHDGANFILLTKDRDFIPFVKTARAMGCMVFCPHLDQTSLDLVKVSQRFSDLPKFARHFLGESTVLKSFRKTLSSTISSANRRALFERKLSVRKENKRRICHLLESPSLWERCATTQELDILLPYKIPLESGQVHEYKAFIIQIRESLGLGVEHIVPRQWIKYFSVSAVFTVFYLHNRPVELHVNLM